MIRSPSFSAWNNYKSFNSKIPGRAHSSKDRSIPIANLKGTPLRGKTLPLMMSLRAFLHSSLLSKPNITDELW